ncbi:hypothetical protein JQC91_16470 [Jannaschia sp. Os4]|uniref:hypothetical protein n=1 Tax=Jannaschia sp. Os4 TaxID=2807617 RepID=UPI001939C331|nr:hypothetical protein [Jannaschia sp. Os4]MBM2577903.1 hypothetical protein [Jannaschia sp. Os4]
MRALALLLLPLAACSDLPPPSIPADSAALAGPPPSLVPLDDVLGAADRPIRAASVGAELDARVARVKARAPQAPRNADLVRRAVRLQRRLPPLPPESDLAARGERLRARADALRAAPL